MAFLDEFEGVNFGELAFLKNQKPFVYSGHIRMERSWKEGSIKTRIETEKSEDAKMRRCEVARLKRGFY